MKQSFFRSTLFATFAMSVLLFTACKKEKMDTPPPVKSYIGEWVLEQTVEGTTTKSTATFTDKTFELNNYNKTEKGYDLDGTIKGTYTADEKALIFSITITEFLKSENGITISFKKGDPNFEEVISKIKGYQSIGYSVEGDKLSLTINNVKKTYTRVKK